MRDPAKDRERERVTTMVGPESRSAAPTRGREEARASNRRHPLRRLMEPARAAVSRATACPGIARTEPASGVGPAVRASRALTVPMGLARAMERAEVAAR